MEHITVIGGFAGESEPMLYTVMSNAAGCEIGHFIWHDEAGLYVFAPRMGFDYSLGVLLEIALCLSNPGVYAEATIDAEG